MMSTVLSVVEDVRRFNRFYTRVLGLLRPNLAGSPFGLTEARVLFELAHGEDVAVSQLRTDLDLDAGYLSRILSNLSAAGLVAREQSATDGRRQVARLTPAGTAAFAELDRLQAKAIDELLASLRDTQRFELVTAMARIRDMLGDERQATGLVLRAPEPGDLGWVVERHGFRYAAEYGWDVTFEALVARLVADFAERGNPQPRGGVDRRAGRRAGWVRVLYRRRDPAHRAATPAIRRAIGARSRRGQPAGGRVSTLRHQIRLYPNHVVDQRCAFGCPAYLRTRRLSMRSSRAAPQFRTRPGR